MDNTSTKVSDTTQRLCCCNRLCPCICCAISFNCWPLLRPCSTVFTASLWQAWPFLLCCVTLRWSLNYKSSNSTLGGPAFAILHKIATITFIHTMLSKILVSSTLCHLSKQCHICGRQMHDASLQVSNYNGLSQLGKQCTEKQAPGIRVARAFWQISLHGLCCGT